MSAGYAARLSPYPYKGVVGLPETFDTQRQVSCKVDRLARLVQSAQHVVVLTGAGISTAAGIPDFRGPAGIWTLETKTKKKKTKTTNNQKRQRTTTSAEPMDFSKARPTLTHRAITYLVQQKEIMVQYCVTQNVDGLHKRAGLSRNYHSSVHGCAFTESCPVCRTEYYRDYDLGGMSFQPTGNKCSRNGCPGELRDTLLDWEDALPAADFARAEAECDKADLVLCLGTSLRIEPAGSLPLRAKKFVIVNLQDTPKNEFAEMIIKARVDEVMSELMIKLGFEGWEKEADPPIEREWTPPCTDKEIAR